MKNEKGKEEKFGWPKLNLWNRFKEKESQKYTKALDYLITEISPCCNICKITPCKSSCPNPQKTSYCEKLPTVTKLINLVFFNKF